MGARGPIRKDTSINRNKPVTLKVLPHEVEAPRPPAGLSTKTRRRWRALWNSGVGAAWDPVADYAVLERLALAYDELAHVEAVLKKARLTTAPSGSPALNPLASYVRDIKAEIAHNETQLGLTPMARARLGLTIGQAKLTAQELNRRLEDPGERQPRVWEGQWTEG